MNIPSVPSGSRQFPLTDSDQPSPIRPPAASPTPSHPAFASYEDEDTPHASDIETGEDEDVKEGDAVRSPTTRCDIPTFDELIDASDSVEYTQPLILLRGPSLRDEAWQSVKEFYESDGCIRFPSRIRPPKQSGGPPPMTHVPRCKRSQIPPNGFKVVVSVHNIKLSPSIRVKFNLRRQNNVIFRCHIDFPFAPIQKLGGGKQVESIKELVASIDEASRFLTLSFDTDCVVPYRILHIARQPWLITGLREKEMFDLQELADLCQFPEGRRVNIELDIRSDDTNFEELLSMLPTQGQKTLSSTLSKLRWGPYRDDSNKVGIQHNMMRHRVATLTCGHPGLPIPASFVPVDSDEILVTRAYGAHLELQEHLMFVRAISDISYWLQLYSIGNNVFAAIFWSGLPRISIPGQKFVPPSGTQVKLKIHQGTLLDERRPDIEANGMVVVDQFGFPPHRFLVLIGDKDAEFFGSLQEPLFGPKMRPAKSPSKVQALLSMYASDLTYAYEIDAVQTIMTAEACSRWRPMMLFDGSPLPCSDPFAGVPHEVKTSAWRTLKKAVPWTLRQFEVIKNLREMSGGALLVQAPGGCGKTTLLIHIVQYAVDCKQYVMITGPTNDTVDDIIMKLPERSGAVRVYAMSQERLRGFVPNTAGPSLGSGYESYVVLQTYHEIMKHKKKICHGLTERTIEWKVLKNMARGPLMGTFRQIDKHGRCIQREQEDFRAYFRDRHERLAKHTPWDEKHWPDGEEVRFLDQAYGRLRKEVLREASVIGCTNFVAGTDFVRKNFARNATDTNGVIVVQDESQAILETQAIIPLTRTIGKGAGEGGFGQHVNALIQFGDTQQQDGFVLSRDGRNNTTNEFVEQRKISLFARLIKAGFNVHTLDEQRRLHPIIMAMVNQFHYDFAIRPSKKDWPLDPMCENLVADIIGADPGGLSETRRRLAWLHTKNGEPLVDPSTFSRANMTDLAIVDEKILPAFRKAFGKETRMLSGIGVPYSCMKALIMKLYRQKCNNEGWAWEELPEIHCVDSLREKEKKVFCLVLVNNGKNEGFLKDKKRACLMFTRAMEVEIVVGGSFTSSPDDIFMKTLVNPETKKEVEFNISSPLAYYFEQFSNLGCTHLMDIEPLAVPPEVRLEPVKEYTTAWEDDTAAAAAAGNEW